MRAHHVSNQPSEPAGRRPTHPSPHAGRNTNRLPFRSAFTSGKTRRHMAYLLLHNPRCSKSRAALELLQERGLEVEVRDYQKAPLSLDELRILHKRLGLPVAQWIRWEEDDAKGVDRSASDHELLRELAAAPKMLQRPILVHGDKALVGRPGPENLEPLL